MRLCRSLHQSNNPLYLEVQPWVYSRESDCFVNVREKVNLEGGWERFGWAIWQPCGAFLAAQHHCVYEPPTISSWIDITPNRSDAEKILFLPDEKAVYENKRVDNKRLALVDDDRVREFDCLCGEQVEVDNSLRGKGLSAESRDALERHRSKLNLRSTSLRRELCNAYPLPDLPMK